jgi:hypothetical protein
VGVRVEFVRVEYDVEAAMRGIRESDLPDDFADYLRMGGLPARQNLGAPTSSSS